MKREILLVPVGSVRTEVCNWLAEALPSVFDCTCRTAPSLPHPEFAWNARRKQYSAEIVLTHVDPGEKFLALAIADLDLYVPDLNFVFGLAQRGARRAVIALPRLRPSFYGMPNDTILFRQRVVKEAVHELGHLFGLGHCDDRRCVMAFSNRLADTDFKIGTFCKQCEKQLQHSLRDK